MQTFLTKINKDNFHRIFAYRNELNFIKNCTYRDEVKSLEEFDKELEEDFVKDRLVQFLILDFRKKPIGTIYAYSYNSSDNYAFVTVYISDFATNKSYGIKAFVIFADYLFQKYNLYKLYFDVYSFNYAMLSILEKCNFNIEGKFKNQKLLEGKRYDVNRFAFYRENLKYWKRKLKVTTANILYS